MRKIGITLITFLFTLFIYSFQVDKTYSLTILQNNFDTYNIDVTLNIPSDTNQFILFDAENPKYIELQNSGRVVRKNYSFNDVQKGIYLITIIDNDDKKHGEIITIR